MHGMGAGSVRVGHLLRCLRFFVTCAACCAVSSPKYSLDDLLALYQKPAMYIFVVLSTFDERVRETPTHPPPFTRLPCVLGYLSRP